MKILLVGDVVGRPGRKAFKNITPQIKAAENIDVVIVNGENSAGGKGITQKSLDELIAGGADIITAGNHIWDKKDVFEFIDREPFLIRPANYPEGAPGKGYCIFPYRAKNIAVINLSGRTFMPPMDCPFQKVEEILREIKDRADIIVIDFHAEATSEKMALGYYLDGRVNAVVGTHTHTQTADERILPNGTAYITDLGMVGPWESILGVKKDIIVNKFISGLPARFDVAEGEAVYSALIAEIDDSSNKTVGVKRIQIRPGENYEKI